MRRGDVALEQRELAAARHLQQAEQAQQRALAGAGRPHQEDEVATRQLEVQLAQDLGAVAIAHRNVVEPEHDAAQCSLSQIYQILKIAQPRIFVQSLLN